MPISAILLVDVGWRDMVASLHDTKASQPGYYRINVAGTIRGDWSDWLNGLEILTEPGPFGAQVTTLRGWVTDQAALRGILCRLWDLNLTILSVHRLE